MCTDGNDDTIGRKHSVELSVPDWVKYGIKLMPDRQGDVVQQAYPN